VLSLQIIISLLLVCYDRLKLLYFVACHDQVTFHLVIRFVQLFMVILKLFVVLKVSKLGALRLLKLFSKFTLSRSELAYLLVEAFGQDFNRISRSTGVITLREDLRIFELQGFNLIKVFVLQFSGLLQLGSKMVYLVHKAVKPFLS